MKYFLAEGVAHQQAVFTSQTSSDGRDLLASLPGLADTAAEVEAGVGAQDAGEKMKIAWRYEGQSSTKEGADQGAGRGGRVGGAASQFSLLRVMPQELVVRSDPVSWEPEVVTGPC